MRLALDHLVIAARTLGEGVAWCDATLGLRPEAGGRHAFMGTHNRVFTLGDAAFPRAYAEIIAIDPDPDAAAPTDHARWFDLDDPALQRALAQGPRLVHWVARCADIVAAHRALAATGIDCGTILAAERATPQGLLRWQISVRADGRRPLGGAAPALIEWGDVHPTDSLAPSGVTLQSLQLGLGAAADAGLGALLPAGVSAGTSLGAAPLRAVLLGRRGPVTLDSPPAGG